MNRVQGFLEKISRNIDWPPAHRAYGSERGSIQRDAFRREKYLKSNYGKRYIKSMIRDYLSEHSTGRA